METKKLNKDELRKKLTPMQYKVTQEEATETPFKISIGIIKKRESMLI